MAKVVLGTFPSKARAERAVDRLKSEGFPEDQISIISKGEQEQGQESQGQSGGQMQEASDGIGWGAGIGAGAGLLASAGLLAVPGIGPLLAAGPLAATLSGAVIGGLAGGLTDWGLPEERGRYYEERVRQGNVLTAVQCEAQRSDEAERILMESGADDVESHDSKQNR